jgi:hypothetical protein
MGVPRTSGSITLDTIFLIGVPTTRPVVALAALRGLLLAPLPHRPYRRYGPFTGLTGSFAAGEGQLPGGFLVSPGSAVPTEAG